VNDVIWSPSAELVEQANVTRLIRRLGCADYHELHRCSIEEPDRFWPEVIDDLGLEFSQPWERVLDDSRWPGVGEVVRRRRGSTSRETAFTLARRSGEAAVLARRRTAHARR
jgi:hypothetical protein